VKIPKTSGGTPVWKQITQTIFGAHNNRRFLGKHEKLANDKKEGQMPKKLPACNM